MTSPVCRNCGILERKDYRLGGFLKNGAHRFRCKRCGKWGKINLDVTSKLKLLSFTDDGRSATATFCTDEQVLDTSMDSMGVDESVWEIQKKQISTTQGKVPKTTVKVWMKKKSNDLQMSNILMDFKLSAHQFEPKIQPTLFPKMKAGMLYEIEMPDMHIGKLTWGEESGEDTDIKSQVADAKSVITDLLSHTQHYPISKILLPLGNDYYNVDNNLNMTTHGTPQQEDTRWRKSFKIGWQLAADIINMCVQVAPVDVIIVGGNHDEQRSFYLGETLSALYTNQKHVHVDNGAKLRKYYRFGTNLIGLTHGYWEKLRDLSGLMSYEVPEMWSQTAYREWHTGDKHHKDEWVHKTHEMGNDGVVIRILRSLTTPDAWHYSKGYVGALRASEAFLFHEKEKIKAQFTATPRQST